MDAQSLVRLVDALGTLGEGGIVLDGAKLLHANAAYLSMLGYSLEELRAMPSLLELIAPEEKQRVRERYLGHGLDVPLQEQYETVLVARDGRRVPVELTSLHVRDAPGTLVLSLARDLTVAKGHEAERRETAELFRRAFDDAALGMAVFDAVGKYLRVNRAFAQMVGYAPEELVGRSYLDLTFPDDQKPIYDTGHEFVESRHPTLRFEKRYRHKDGHAVWAHVTTSALRDAEGARPRLFITQMLDITQRKHAEEEARRQVVSKTLVHLLLRDIAGRAASATPTREMGRRLVEGAARGGVRDVALYLASYRELGAGELRLVAREEDRFTFAGTDLLETVASAAQPTCHLALGYLEGVVAAATGTSALGAETQCRSMGHAECRFIVHAR